MGEGQLPSPSFFSLSNTLPPQDPLNCSQSPSYANLSVSMRSSLWYRLKKLETSRLRGTAFYPPIPEAFEHLCIGTKSRNLGDALVLTPLFSKLKEHYPAMRITGFVRAFNPVVLKHSPDFFPIERGPKALYGDDLNLGSGHLIEQKFNALGLSYRKEEIRPQIHLSPDERKIACEILSGLFSEEKMNSPLWVIHPSGHTWRSVLPDQIWEKWLKTLPHQHRILQLGIPGDSPIPGASLFQIDPSTQESARVVFALIQAASFFIGVDSGPMHVAAAFQIPSLILVKTKHTGDLKTAMENRDHLPYFHPLVRPFANLYVQNQHVELNSPKFEKDVYQWIEEAKTRRSSP